MPPGCRGAPADYLWHVLAYVRLIFYTVETEAPVNAEAARLYDTAPDVFQMRVQQSLQHADTELNAPDVDSVIKSVVFVCLLFL